MVDKSDVDRGELDARGMLLVFVGLVGALALYVGDWTNPARVALWFLAFVGVGAHLIARAFQLGPVQWLILIFVGVVGAVVIYADDPDHLLYAIVWLVAYVVAGVYRSGLLRA